MDQALDEDASFALRTLKLIAPKEGTPFHDLWDSFPGERHVLVSLLRSTSAVPVVHVGVESELRESGELIAHEWTTPSVTSQNLGDKMDPISAEFRRLALLNGWHVVRSLGTLVDAAAVAG